MNLTRITEPAEMAHKHFLDSLAPARLGLLPERGAVLDVGSGAGFPGIPLAILRPELEWTLLDAQRKKVDFITMCVDRLGITNVRALQGRAEELPEPKIFTENLILWRRVQSPLCFIELCTGFCRLSGKSSLTKALRRRQKPRRPKRLQKPLVCGFWDLRCRGCRAVALDCRL